MPRKMAIDYERATLNTPIRKEILDAFREKCYQQQIPMNTCIELFMSAFVENKFKISFVKNTNTPKEIKLK